MYEILRAITLVCMWAAIAGNVWAMCLWIRVRKQFEKKISMIDLTFDKK